MTTSTIQKTPITADHLVDLLMNDSFWGQLVDEVFHDLRTHRMMLDWAEEFAADRGLEILDPERLEDDLYQAYRLTEKGLS